MATQIFEMGYSGIGVIDNTNVLATSGNLNEEKNISNITPFYLPPSTGFGGGNSITKVQYCKGTRSASGSISFDVNTASANLLTSSRLFSVLSVKTAESKS